MSIEGNAAKHAIQSKLESQINTAEAKLQTLKARAEAAKANVEVAAIGNLLAQTVALHQKLQALQKSGADRWDQAKADFEAKIAGFEKSVKEVEAKVKLR
jgi:hypothetical protein